MNDDLNDDRPRDVAGEPVVQYRIPIVATLVFTATMIVVYLLGQNALRYDPYEQSAVNVREVISLDEPRSEPAEPIAVSGETEDP